MHPTILLASVTLLFGQLGLATFDVGLNKKFLVEMIQRDFIQPVMPAFHNVHRHIRRQTPSNTTQTTNTTQPSSSSSVSCSPSQTSNATIPNNESTGMKLVTNMQGKSFFNYFDFFTWPDPTHGNVQYVSGSSAMSGKNKLAYVNKDNRVILAVDSTNKVAKGGQRKSVRITSKQPLVKGQMLVMAVKHMPTGCATWPAFWTVGNNWPAGGEIDIIEGVNKNKQNQMTLHTNTGCAISGSTNATGSVLVSDCDAAAYNGANFGCGVQEADKKSFGSAFNSLGQGGWYAMLWDDQGIRIWFFTTANVPSDLKKNTPKPTGWPVPSAFWPSSICDDFDSHFGNQTIVINTTLCGDWAAASGVYSPTCPGTCASFITNPANFKQA